ncbi:MAG TPA: homoserine O-succinyltransferase [Prolixibacteraceae bacterium]|nr:homoserine O-succinyltransferase [Prolixibacteraceae bacterium]HPS12773.1 homoserine O-succinyltransferase [Prolixibacteraceae bacterium]
MPVNIPDTLPAIEALKKENIFVIDSTRASHQDIRPLRIAILNLMPVKVTTETDLIRLLSNTPLQLEIDLVKITDHSSKNTSEEHMQSFYVDFNLIKHRKYDGLIVTGAPVEQLEYEDVTYWNELKEIFDWAKTNVQSSLFICWASMAALYHYYGVPKYPLEKKVFGVFHHTLSDPKLPIFRGFDDEFHVPHSRFSEVHREDIAKIPDLEIISESDEAGVYMAKDRANRQIFVTGHSEYAPLTLDEEYKRDLAKGLPMDPPKHYYRKNDPSKQPVVKWRSQANLFFQNWLNYYVYQETPYNIEEIR